MWRLAARHPRYGYRRIWALLRREGWSINRKRVYRLWPSCGARRAEGLKVTRRRAPKRSRGSSENSCTVRKAEHPNHVWTWDFIHDRTLGGRPLKLLSLVDEYTRECLALEVSDSITAQDAIAVLHRQFLLRGSPGCIRSDNGPEFIAKAIQGWLTVASVETLYVAPGSPWENGYVEAFHSRLRDEFLNMEAFASLKEAQALANLWRLDYNHERPHSSLGYLTPTEFRERCGKDATTAEAGQTRLEPEP
jgi:transposase InsO family protein